MRNAKMNKFIIWGLLINSFYIGIKQFIAIPDSIACFVIGIGVCLLVFGIYATNHDITFGKETC
jgi:uncharacterized membrane protein